MTKNFKKHEFECNCGCEMPDEVYSRVIKLAVELQKLRDIFGVPFSPTSAYRCPEYNLNVGGVSNSQHLLGFAADLQVPDVEPEEVAGMIESLMDSGDILMGGVGRYNTFTHMDIRGRRARWDKTSDI
jgi:uncharacterized protein YcbK (DUF882 family)